LVLGGGQTGRNIRAGCDLSGLDLRQIETR
jgi:hypothetical protein